MSRTRAKAARHRPKIGATVDPALLRAVDEWLQDNPGFDRSKVIDEALGQWYARVQEQAMVEQYASPAELDDDEWRGWQQIQRAANARQLAPRTRHDT